MPDAGRFFRAKSAAVRLFRFLWRGQASFNALLLEAGNGVAGALEENRAAIDRQAQRVAEELASTRSEFLRRDGAQDARLAHLESLRAAAAPAASAGPGAPAPALPAGVYALFEERFRGRPEEIARGQRVYLEELRDLPGPVLDVGCGRGEFLGMLKAAGIPAAGLESNPVSVEACRRAGLEVETGDALELMGRRPAGKLGAVVAFQVVEHWPPEGIFRFLQDARRALAPGGVLIAETINADSLSALRAFYLDPTHVRPVPPQALRFLAEAAGFTDARIEYRSPLPAGERLEETFGECEAVERAPVRAPGLCAHRPRAEPRVRSRRVLVLAVQTPFARGGAERHVQRLTEELVRRGVEADLVTLPLVERERFDLVRSAAAWRSLDLTEAGGRPVDAVIATRFPSYAVRHPNKLVWLIHQYRQAYDQFGTPFSDLTASPEDRRTREVIAEIDRVGLTEARKVFANSQTVAARLLRFNGIRSRAALPSSAARGPAPQRRLRRHGALGRAARRLEASGAPARVAASRARRPARSSSAGDRRRTVFAAVRRSSAWSRGSTSSRPSDDEELLDLYANARIVAVTASGEDLGYVPIEAHLSGKPVLTTEDAGGPLEFVRDGETGLVVAPRPEALGVALRLAWTRLEALKAMGEAGRRRAARLTWDEPVDRLLAAAGLA